MPENTPRNDEPRPVSVWDGFYSTAQVARLAGVPRSTLYAWKKKGIIGPSIAVHSEDKLVEEGYSYADLAIIRLLRGLKDKQLTRKSLIVALRHLLERFGSFDNRRWEQAHLYVLDKEVYAQKPDEWDATVATRGGQRLLLTPPQLFEEEAGILIPKSFRDYVEIDPKIMDGLPVVANTRIPTTTLAMMHEQGVSFSELADLYFPIPRETLEMAVEYERSLDAAIAA